MLKVTTILAVGLVFQIDTRDESRCSSINKYCICFEACRSQGSLLRFVQLLGLVMSLSSLRPMSNSIDTQETFGDSRPPVARKPKFSKLADRSGSGDSRVEPIKEEEEKVAEVAATTETKVLML
ncbi:hypothetical protein Tco_0905983 [Tanacetum coccineum]